MMPTQRTLWGEDEAISFRGAKWTDAEERRLAELWGVWGIEKIAEELRREPSTIRAHAFAIGLSGGVPSGYEPFATAARRNGVSVRDVIRAAWLHNVPKAASLSWIPGERKVKYVDASLIDEAIAKWRHEPPVRKHKRKGCTE